MRFDPPFVTRRRVLQGGLAAGLTLVPGLPSVAYAAGDARDGTAAGADALVVVFLRGGADTLNLVAPVNDPDYQAARPSDLRVAENGPAAGLPLSQTMAPALDFRLHPEATPLAELYRDGRLAIIHAAGLTDGTRSHFVAQDLMERGVGAEAELSRIEVGWAARWLSARGGLNGVAAMASTPHTPAALSGYPSALAVADLRAGLAPPGGPQTAEVLAGLMRGDGAYARASRTALEGLSVIDTRLPRLPDGKVAPYSAEDGAVYEETEAGRGLQSVARLLKMDIGLRLAWVDVGGWDTHDHQAGRFSSAVRQLSRALAAFWTDSARNHGRVTVLVMSEFGRRLRANKSGGTDHGHGGAMLVLGDRVAGGRMFGRWPGLSSAQLDRGVDLAVTTDYRAVLAELVGPSIFPGYSAQRVGVMV